MTLLKNDISQHAKSQTDEEFFVELLGDESSGGRITIETEHAKIHAGLTFDFTVINATLAAAGSHYILIKPNGAGVHVRRLGIHGDNTPVLVELFESPAGTADGAEQSAPVNRNRYSSIPSPLRFYLNPTVTNTGTLLRTEPVYSGKKESGESNGLGLEWILKGDLVYLLKITNNAAQDLNYQLDSFFYYQSDPSL